MTLLHETSLFQFARSISATGQIIEAHADRDDTVRKVLIELSESMQNIQLREAVSQLWLNDGFIATVSRDGLLMIDGMRDDKQHASLDLLAVVGHQLKEYAKATLQQQAREDMAGTHTDVAFLADVAKSRDSLSVN